MGIAGRLARHRALAVWLAVLVPVPLAILGCVLLEIARWEHAEPQPPLRPFVEWYLTLGATPTVAVVLGWFATRSARRTIALAAAGFVAFFVWLIVYLEIRVWVTGVPIFPTYD